MKVLEFTVALNKSLGNKIYLVQESFSKTRIETEIRNNSLSTYKFRTPNFYCKYIRVLCKEESKISSNDLNPTNKAQKITKDSQHVAGDGGDIQECRCLVYVYIRGDGEVQEEEYELSKSLFYSLIEICPFFPFLNLKKWV